MIRFDDKIVGSIWVDLRAIEEVSAPAVHIMVGDSSARGQGVGSASISAVIDYLRKQGDEAIYSRSLIKNTVAAKLLEENGFWPLGDTYTDSDGLEWQNAKLDLAKHRVFLVI